MEVSAVGYITFPVAGYQEEVKADGQACGRYTDWESKKIKMSFLCFHQLSRHTVSISQMRHSVAKGRTRQSWGDVIVEEGRRDSREQRRRNKDEEI